MSEKNINRLLESVQNAAEFRADSIRREVDAAEAAALRGYRDSLRRSAEASRRRSESRAADESAESAAEGAAEIRRSLYRHRDEIADKVFTRVEKEVRDFVLSEDYLPRLMELAAEATTMISHREGARLLLRREDECHRSAVESAVGLPVLTCERFSLGGIMGVCPELEVDLTFDEGLRQARADFAKQSGLSVV